jgi:hypothetical protein
MSTRPLTPDASAWPTNEDMQAAMRNRPADQPAPSEPAPPAPEAPAPLPAAPLPPPPYRTFPPSPPGFS